MTETNLNQNEDFSITIDIGTSTVKAYLVKNKNINGKNDIEILKELEERNSQYLYGKDVISRVMYSHYNGNSKLQEAIVFQISSLIKRLVENQKDISFITITGNSVMLSILEGFSLEGFEKFPFKSPSLFGYFSKNPLISKDLSYYLPPAIDAFLGADSVTATLWAFQEQKPFLLVDIGTNGEILLVEENKITATSCAAGPAFEGKNLSRKITGSVAVESLSKMIEGGIIDRTGLILDGADYGESTEDVKGFLNQEDVRQLQLAKAAIRAGIETLIKESQLSINKIKSCIICGNFGNALSENALINIGVLPKEFLGKIKYLGNGAGLGASLLSKEEKRELVKKIATQTKTIELGGNPFFNDAYIKHIDF